MGRLIYTILFLLAIPLTGYQQKFDTDLDDEKYLNFLAAIQNRSTFNYFTVIKVKDLNTGVIKEVCTKGNFVSGALHRELNVGYNKEESQKVIDFAKLKKDRYFEFANHEALRNISFFDYKTELVDKIQDEYDFDEVVQIIKNEKEFAIQLSKSEMKAFAHVLFNKGFLTGENNCFGGTLKFVDKIKYDK